VSSVVLNTRPIDDMLEHPNADKLEIAQFLGWNCVVPKDMFKKGDVATFFPPELLLPQELADGLGVTKYLKGFGKKSYPDGHLYAGRIGVARLRGVPSYGILVPPHADWLGHGDDLAAYLGVVKRDPPEEYYAGDADRSNVFFHKYTDIENLRNFPTAQEGDHIVAVEKIHGTNSRMGLCREDDQMTLMAGSHDIRRKKYLVSDPEKMSLYWKPLDMHPNLAEMLSAISIKHNDANVIVFGEIYGAGIQDLQYGLCRDQIAYAVFDISIDGLYLSHSMIEHWTRVFDIPMAPCSFIGRFDFNFLEIVASGNTVLMPEETAHIREGVVVRSLVEGHNIYGRKIYKLLNFDYLNRKGGTERH